MKKVNYLVREVRDCLLIATQSPIFGISFTGMSTSKTSLRADMQSA